MAVLHRLIYLSFFLFLAACSSPQPMVSRFVYTPVATPNLQAEKIPINKPMDEAWVYLIAQLKRNLFTITNIDRNKRLVTLNISQGVHQFGVGPWWLQYASCGSTHRVNTYKGKETVYNYPVLGNKSYIAASRGIDGYHYQDVITATVSPAINLNIYLRVVSPDITSLQVDANYVFSQNSTRKRYSLRENGRYVSDRQTSQNKKTITINSYKATAFDTDVEPPILCYSTGAFEESVLSVFR